MHDNSQIAVLSFYSFINIEAPELLLSKILLTGKRKYIKGTILISYEGFNGSISGSSQNVKLLVDEIIKLTLARNVNIKINYCDIHPFHKLKVKLKKEIVTIALSTLDVETLKGKYIAPKDWDNFISQDDVILLDNRNNYEIKIGRFKNSIDPNIDTFKQFPTWVAQNRQLLFGQKIATYCTGGIRCEKSTAYLKKLGFNDVYHLKGGILQYFEETSNKNNLWSGECFVFDDRRAVTSDLSPAEGYWIRS